MSEPCLDYAIVLDNGSWEVRGGFAGDDGPMLVMPNLIGKSDDCQHVLFNDVSSIGSYAQEKRELLCLRKPIEHGIIVDWESMEKVWNYTFKYLHVSPEQHPVLVGERPLNPRGNRENLTQVMFENYNTPGFYIASEPILALYSAGRLCGTMVDVGEGVSHVVPVSEGIAPKQAIKRVDIAGDEVTKRLQALFQQKGLSFTTTAELDMVRDIKEKCCFVKEEPSIKLEYNSKKVDVIQHYKLPDGQNIDVGPECYMCSEVLFQPDGTCLGKLIADAINSCDIADRKNLMSDIILSGGTTFLKGLKKRLMNDLISCIPHAGSAGIKIKDYPERKYHVWIGGSILASLSSFSQMWITKSEYNEYGPNIIHRKCL